MEREELATDLAMTFAEIARTLWAAPTVQATLQRIVEVSVQAVDGCDGASISVIGDDVVTSPASTDPLVLAVDDLQYSTGEGPALDAIAETTMVYAGDLRDDARWPTLGPLAGEKGMRSLLSFHLLGSTTRGALNLYAHLPDAYGAGDRAKAAILAAHAGMALAAAEALDEVTEQLEVQTKRLEQLHDAMRSRELIGQAQGVLMHRELITSEQAFDLLRRASQNLNLQLRLVAQTVVDTGDLPDGLLR